MYDEKEKKCIKNRDQVEDNMCHLDYKEGINRVTMTTLPIGQLEMFI